MPDILIIFGAKYLLWVLAGTALIWFLKQPGGKQKQLIFFGLIVFPVIFLISRLAASFYYDSRPFVVGHFIPLIPHEPDNGFPSDHTLLAAAIAGVIYPFSKKVSVLGWVFTILTGLFRVLAGIHYPIDIAGSIIIAIFSAVLIYYGPFSRINQRRTQNF